MYNEDYYLYENVSTGRARASRSGLTQQKPHETADQIRRQAANARRAAAAAQAAQEAADARRAHREARQASVKPLSSGPVKAEDKVLRGKKGSTPYGIARARRTRIAQQIQKLSKDATAPIDASVRLYKRLEGMDRAIGRRKTWGSRAEEITYLLDYLIDEGYVDSLESAVEIAENMSNEWLYSVLYE